MAVTLLIEAVAAPADTMFTLLFVQVNWSVIETRKTRPDLPRAYTIPYMPWPPLIGIVLQFMFTCFLLSALGLHRGRRGVSRIHRTRHDDHLDGTRSRRLYGYSQQKEEKKLEEETWTESSRSHLRRAVEQMGPARDAVWSLQKEGGASSPSVPPWDV